MELKGRKQETKGERAGARLEEKKKENREICMGRRYVGGSARVGSFRRDVVSDSELLSYTW